MVSRYKSWLHNLHSIFHTRRCININKLLAYPKKKKKTEFIKKSELNHEIQIICTMAGPITWVWACLMIVWVGEPCSLSCLNRSNPLGPSLINCWDWLQFNQQIYSGSKLQPISSNDNDDDDNNNNNTNTWKIGYLIINQTYII
jgi:hypothetical protein